MKVIVFVLFCFAASCLTAQAQTPTLLVGQTFQVQATHDGANVTAFGLYRDGVKVGTDLLPSQLVAGTMTFPVTSGFTTAGAHTIEVEAYDGVSGLSARASLVVQVTAVTAPPPTAPKAPTSLKIIPVATNAPAGALPTYTAPKP